MAEIAIFGGTFDPPTVAHESIVRSCLQRDDIDEVWLMPSGWREDKPGMSSDEQRLDLLQAMHTHGFQGDSRLHISEFELNLPRPTQTVRTLQALQQEFTDHTWWHVFGADSYYDMPRWQGGAELQQTIGMLLVPRAGSILPPEGQNIRHLSMPGTFNPNFSSTKIREAVAVGLPFEHMAAQGVAQVIRARQLYAPVRTSVGSLQ